MTVHAKKPLAVIAHNASAAAHSGFARSGAGTAVRPVEKPSKSPAGADNHAHTGTHAHAGASSKALMSVGQLAMLTVVAVASLRSLPAMADYGLASILLYLIPAVFFLVPAALVAAELATGWKGGVYVWVREAFGNRFGFLAIWLQWIQNVVWYPIQIAFIAVSLSYVFCSVPAIWAITACTLPQ